MAVPLSFSRLLYLFCYNLFFFALADFSVSRKNSLLDGPVICRTDMAIMRSKKNMTFCLLIGCLVDRSTGLQHCTVTGKEVVNKFQVKLMLFPEVFFKPINKKKSGAADRIEMNKVCFVCRICRQKCKKTLKCREKNIYPLNIVML